MDTAKKLKPLDNREKIFVKEYLVDLDPMRAAVAAGYSKTTASAKSYGWVGKSGDKPHVYAAVTEALEKRAAKIEQKAEINAERVLKELARLAFFDARKLFRPDGSPMPINELDDDTAAALAGMEIAEIWEGTGEDRVFVGYAKKYRVVDKNTALTNAMKHLGMLRDKVELTGNDGGPVQQQVTQKVSIDFEAIKAKVAKK